MKRTLLALCFALLTALLLVLVASGQTYSFNVAWDDPNTADDQVVSYTVYESPDGINYLPVQSVTVLEAEIEVQVKTGLHWYVVTATNQIGLESEYSNVLKVQTDNPKKLSLRVVE